MATVTNLSQGELTNPSQSGLTNLSQSKLLSQRQTRDGGGRSINNEEAKTFDMKLKNIIPNVKCKKELFFKNKYRLIKLKNIKPLKKKKIEALVFCPNTVVIKMQ